MGGTTDMVITKRDIIILVVCFFLGIGAGTAIGFGLFYKKVIPYIQGEEVHRLDSLNSVMKDSVKYWKFQQSKADSTLLILDSIIIQKNIRYEILRKKIRDADADGSNAILNGFLSE